MKKINSTPLLLKRTQSTAPQIEPKDKMVTHRTRELWNDNPTVGAGVGSGGGGALTRIHSQFGTNATHDCFTTTSIEVAGRDVLTVNTFSMDDLHHLFEVPHEMRAMVSRVGNWDLLKGKIFGALFSEPSTRKSGSFAAAMQRLTW